MISKAWGLKACRQREELATFQFRSGKVLAVEVIPNHLDHRRGDDLRNSDAAADASKLQNLGGRERHISIESRIDGTRALDFCQRDLAAITT
jgi:hypothetical protein